MQGDFFQVLRRVQKEERNKSSLARVDSDFYKQLRDYIKDLERSVASDPFGNEQLLLNNAQRIATEICELRESKITKAANNNIYRSFLLFKKDNPQFDLLDTTPLNLTDEEETLYFSLMDALKNHRYRISLDEYTEESALSDDLEEEDFDEEDIDADDEAGFVEDSYGESSQSIESESTIDDLEDEISSALGESNEKESPVQKEVSPSTDEVLNRLNEIRGAKVVTDEKYENIDRQVANQRYPGKFAQSDSEVEVPVEGSGLVDAQEEVKVEAQEPKEEVQTKREETSKRDGIASNGIDNIFKDPDSQFVDLDRLEPNYDDDYYQSIAAGSNYAAPSEDDFNMIFAKPKKPKSDEAKRPEIKEEPSSKVKSTETDLGFSSGLDVKTGQERGTGSFNEPAQESKEEDAPKKPVDKTRGGLFSRDEIENATVVISEDIGEMVGIDGKVYGPFLENDVVILPNITAQILIENNKATLVKL